jgi:hypothetical protein
MRFIARRDLGAKGVTKTRRLTNIDARRRVVASEQT